MMTAVLFGIGIVLGMIFPINAVIIATLMIGIWQLWDIFNFQPRNILVELPKLYIRFTMLAGIWLATALKHL